jgi:UDP-glucuronate 4-epimerase
MVVTYMIPPLENSLGVTANKNFMLMQPGDVYQTYADIDDLFTVTQYKPSMSVEKGVEKFVQWYKNFYQ